MIIIRIIIFLIGMFLIAGSIYFGLYQGVINIVNGIHSGINASQIAKEVVFTLLYYPVGLALGILILITSITLQE